MNPKDLKVIFIGDSNTGKTSIAYRLVNDTFNPDQQSTIGSCVFELHVKDGSGDLNIHLWDTAGQEKFRSLIPNYSRDAKIVLLVYNISDPESLPRVDQWFDMLKQTAVNMPKIILIGNKVDIADNTSHEDILSKQKQFANDMGANDNNYENYVAAFSTSAKTGEGINLIIQTIRSLSKVKSEVEYKRADQPKNVKIEESTSTKKRSCCSSSKT
ncbi:GTP-binding protein of the rab [Tritrichomonas musculus]|uniref:GTP-binding protein of the rab n=1 Tax=Tritrichomonas musculus TaxID=1915356 RepID=A0ABR2KWZ9_9EUKA